MKFTFKQLEIFVSVAQYAHLGQAAEKLFLTKGAVSLGLQELERQLSVQLFDRVHPRLILNHEGQRLLPIADELLKRANDVEMMFSQDQADHFLALGCSKTIGNYLMPELVKGFLSVTTWMPDVFLGNTAEICGQVASFALDAALLEGEERHPALIFEPWLADEMVVVASKEHPLATGKAVELSELANEHWVLREAHSGSREYFDRYLAPHLPSYKVVLALSSPEAVIGAVAEGLGITFVSQLLVTQSLFSERLAMIRLKQKYPRMFSIAYHAKKYQSVSIKQFLSFCRAWKPHNVII